MSLKSPQSIQLISTSNDNETIELTLTALLTVFHTSRSVSVGRTCTKTEFRRHVGQGNDLLWEQPGANCLCDACLVLPVARQARCLNDRHREHCQRNTRVHAHQISSTAHLGRTTSASHVAIAVRRRKCCSCNQMHITEALLSVLHTCNGVSETNTCCNTRFHSHGAVVWLLVQHNAPIDIIIPATLVMPAGR